ncbi:DNA (cytosine-5-)-methyltransferase [Hathewaya limosa]|uniref:Cytosine-specific methyltransferase n=1 Tax=Hathewaya limosa TaxID=1536 RepID=A0ABU0JV60_HATLI|nr:DNA (cytosine-5-)-methyltransferase [Hathewaya limosa]MDQ0480944.1 DNA (cytosine-5)-methyltransferase 1 [Hathewaya limosa]
MIVKLLSTTYDLSNNQDIALFILKKRNELDITRKEFADALGLPKNGNSLIKAWENGEERPNEQQLKRIIDFPIEPPFKNPLEGKFRIIDLFAGIGGIRLGFSKFGAYTVFSSEWDKFAQKTYRINYGEEPYGDITQVCENDIPNHDILLAGFPCQPFSNAGLKKGFNDTRGTLFFDIARIIKAKKPKAFMLENVKQLKGHDHGNTFQVIENTLKELGYVVYSKVLRSVDFGVPQNRERIIIVGFNEEKMRKTNIEFQFPKPSNKKITVGDILESNVDEKYTISDKLYEGHLKRKEMHKKKGNGFGFSVFNHDSKYTNTISARYYKDGSEALIDQGINKNPRKLTPRECARLQGFPEQFIIPVSDSQAYKQFGNSVSVPVIEAVAEKMLNFMKKTGLL